MKIFLSLFIVLMSGLITPAVEAAVTAAQSQWQVPVLINKKDNPVVRIDVNCPDGNHPHELDEISVAMSGTDPATDVKAVRLFVGGSEGRWNREKAVQIGEQRGPGTTVSFKGKIKLQPGLHYFWITMELNPNAGLDHYLSADVQKIRVDGQWKSVDHLAGPIKHRIGVAVRQHGQEGVNTYRIPGLATTNKGTLLAIYDVRRNSSRDLQGDIDIGLSRSMDGGKTWEPMRIVLDMGEYGGLPQKFNGVSDACILVDRNSDNIFVAGLWMHGVLDRDGRWIEGLTGESEAWEHQWRRRGSQPGYGLMQTSQFLLAKSSDDGRTWSAPVNLTRQVKRRGWWLLAPAPGKGITLADGTLVFPTEGRDEFGRPFSAISYSKDGGDNWVTSHPAFSGTNENQIVQLSDGTIMMNMRFGQNRQDDSERNGRVVCTSKDLGGTWQEHPTSRGALIESACMASLHKHVYRQNGKEKSVLLFSNPNTKKGRHHTTIKVSFDDGDTWPEEYWLLLDEQNNRGYSCLTSIDEHTIGILYEGSQADMTFESIPLSILLTPTKER